MKVGESPTPVWGTVAVVGAGVIGRSWIKVYAIAGCNTRVYDTNQPQVDKAVAWVRSDVAQDVADGSLSQEAARTCMSRISTHPSLVSALEGAQYVQESGPESIPAKRALYAELDRLSAPGAVLGSSTSALDMSEIADGLSGRGRCIVVHPVNPPHLNAAVEIVPGKDTRPEVVTQTCSFIRSVGQTPVMMNHYVTGFIINRLQAALLREAIGLVVNGVADAEAVDACVRDGLGPRWALLGPFGVGSTNADGGIREYFSRYRSIPISIMNDLYPTPSLSPEMIEQIGQSTDKMLGGFPVSELRAWRDRMLRKIHTLKTQNPVPWLR